MTNREAEETLNRLLDMTETQLPEKKRQQLWHLYQMIEGNPPNSIIPHDDAELIEQAAKGKR